MSSGKSKSKGTARSPATVEHGPANSERQKADNRDQVNGLIEAKKRELAELSPQRIAARRVGLQIDVENAEQRVADELAIQSLDLAFNFAKDGTEVSDAADKKLVREADEIQFYWKKRGGARAGEWKSVPLGGDVDETGQSISCAVWYLASNMTQWDTWAVIDGTRAGLNGKALLQEVMFEHALWFGKFTGHRLVCGQCHKKPHNIHGQHWFSGIGDAIPNPGTSDAIVDPNRPTGLLLGRTDMRGRGKSPMRFAFLGKTGCSLANLRRAGYNIREITGDPEMENTLDAWIKKRKRNGRVVLDMESEFALQDIVKTVRSKHPEWEPFFAAAWKRHQEQEAELIRRIHDEISKEEERFDIHDLRARAEAAEKKNEEIKAGAQLALEDSKSKAELNKYLTEQLAATNKPGTQTASSSNETPVAIANFDLRTRITMMGDALRRVLAGIAPTDIDRQFVIRSTSALGGYCLNKGCMDELRVALGNDQVKNDAEQTEGLAAINTFIDFTSAYAALKTLREKLPLTNEQRLLFAEGGFLKPYITSAANTAKRLGKLTNHPCYNNHWGDWSVEASEMLTIEDSAKTELQNSDIGRDEIPEQPLRDLGKE